MMSMAVKLKTWLKAIRVVQWTKNGVVMLAWFFSVADASQREIARGWESFLMAVAMAVSFSFISSSFYLLNDVSDYDADVLHPIKRLRPIAAGFLYPALVVMVLPSRTVAFGTVLAYTTMQCLYTGYLKRVPYVDVVTLSAGFVLRAVAGAAIIAAYISPWLLICTFSLSLFLALCKRKNELETARESRAVLKHYHPKILASLIVVAGLASFAEYLVYTINSKMGERFSYLWLTSIFVFLGIVRYMVLAFGSGDVGRPEKVLLKDRMLWMVITGYGICAVLTVLLGR